MKSYGKKIARQFFKKQARIRTESRDAVLWAIDWNNRICNVKLQGSNELVTAHFPQNVATIMPFMKPGNSVRIAHRGGHRGYIEVIGHGMSIPTPVSGDAHPDTSGLADGVITGLTTSPTSPASMAVVIAEGTYRINETVYTLSGLASSYSLDAAPGSSQWRYDCFYADTAETVTYLKGTASSGEPTKPTLPADTVLIGNYILVWDGVTEVSGQNIGMLWAARTFSSAYISASDTMSWDAGDNYPETNVQVIMWCQYGWALSGDYDITLNKLVGTGQIYSGDTGYHATQVTQSVTGGSSYTFKYQRDQTVTETSPVLQANISNSQDVSTNIKRISLLDAGGSPID
jgi:hypothetical protein